MNIKLDLTLDQVNTILGILNETPLPHKISNPLIAVISKQAQEQYNAANSPAPDPVESEK